MNTFGNEVPLVEAYVVESNIGRPSYQQANFVNTPPPLPPQQNQTQFFYEEFLNDAGAKSFLSSKKWPKGLQNAFLRNLRKIPVRYFICDDSGSMITNDGHRIIDSNGKKKFIQCSRWSELAESLKFHAQLAHESGAPTEFRFLNASQPIMVGKTQDHNNLNKLYSLLDGSPNGQTPLCKHINDVIQQIRSVETQLRNSGQKACVVIATDGLSSDGDIATAMRPLKSLPVWVVVRLCTDEDKVVSYWNNIDQELELDMDVLDDLKGEANEVNENNSWLTYGEPIHRLREFGIILKEFDLLDEGKLSLEHMMQIVCMILDSPPSEFPHPEVNFEGFISQVQQSNKTIAQIWDPREEAMRDWVVPHKIRKSYGQNNFCVIS
eukprot:gene13124-17590_t